MLLFDKTRLVSRREGSSTHFVYLQRRLRLLHKAALGYQSKRCEATGVGASAGIRPGIRVLEGQGCSSVVKTS